MNKETNDTTKGADWQVKDGAKLPYLAKVAGKDFSQQQHLRKKQTNKQKLQVEAKQSRHRKEIKPDWNSRHKRRRGSIVSHRSLQ